MSNTETHSGHHSRNVSRTMVAVAVFAGVAAVAAQQPDNSLVESAWAYAIPTEPRPTIVDDGGKHSLAGTPLTFTRNETRGRDSNDESIRTAPADWYPGDHPVMPEIVAKGDSSRNVIACALCHYPNGKGRPENANPAGLPKAYLIQQMQDFQNGVWDGSEARKGNYTTMINIAKGMTAEEIEQSAEYFSTMTWTSWVEVREAAMVPKTQIIGGMHIKLDGDGAGLEPIGKRIVESPIDAHHTELLRDPRSGFIAYVPPGALAKGESLVRTGGGGRTVQCGICHGEDLNGIGSIPGQSVAFDRKGLPLLFATGQIPHELALAADDVGDKHRQDRSHRPPTTATHSVQLVSVSTVTSNTFRENAARPTSAPMTAPK